MVDIDKDGLRYLYLDCGLTTRQIAEKSAFSQRTIARRLHEFGIKPRPQGPNQHLRLRSEWWCKHHYETLGKSMSEIANDLGASTGVVRTWLHRHGINVRPQCAGLKGKKMSDQGRRLLSLAKRGKCTGPDNPNWKGGYTDPTFAERRSYKAKKWRNAVKSRDGRRCVECGATGKLQAHHIKSWARYPDLRFNLDNGVTLCIPCHENAHNFSFSAYSNDERPRARSTAR